MAEVLLAAPRSASADPNTVAVRDGVGNLHPVPPEYVPPTGVLQMWAGNNTTVPTGWLLCDGSAVSRATYAALFAIIGTFYGAGNGTTTFNLPDMNGRFPRGATASPGGTGGSNSHTHGLTSAVADVRMVIGNSNVQMRSRTSPSTRTLDRGLTSAAAINDPGLSSTAGIALTGDTDSTSTLPSYVNVLFIVKS